MNQKYDLSKVQIILIDGGSRDDSRNIALKYSNAHSNIILLDSEDNIANAYNMGLEYATGEYVNFMGSIDRLSNQVLSKIDKFASKNKLNAVCIPIEVDEKERYPLKFKFKTEKAGPILDLKKEDNYIQVECNSIFIKRSKIKNLTFEDIEHSDAKFINRFFINNEKYGFLEDESYFLRERFDENIDNLRTSIFNSFEYFYRDMINICIENYGAVPKYIQNLFLYFIKDIVEIAKIEEVFGSEDEINEFWNQFVEILSHIDSGVISKNKVLKDRIKNFLIFVKNNEFHIETQGKFISLKSKNHTINNLHNYRIWMDIVELKDGFLNISGTFASSCDKKYLTIEAVKSGRGILKIYEAKEVEYPNTYRETLEFLSIPWFFTYSFDLKIPVGKNESCSVYLILIYDENGDKKILECDIANRYYVNLSEYGNYFVKNNQTVLLKRNVFYIRPHSYIRKANYEFKTMIKVLISKFPLDIKIKTIAFRLLCFLMYPFYKNKKIWIFSDRLDLSGDNGEHFFNYAINVKDDVKKYFVIQSDSKDYARLKKKYGKSVIPFASFKHRFLYVFAKKFMQSQISPKTYNPFSSINPKLMAGLTMGDVYFLQHGVNRYDMSSWMTKFDKNLSLILTVSDFDYNEFTQGNYNYDKEIVQELGYPRYDDLTNDNLKKQIVIMPTWRNYIKNKHQLVNSQYYERFNNLLNNEKLIDYARDKGYEIILKPHPLMYKFIDAFDVNEYVKIDNVTKHHDILCNSALMITDYSSVAFDFVYLKKPVIYYQYEGGKDHHFDVGTLFVDDGSMDFGEIIEDEDKLIEKILEYIDNDCQMEEIYQKRVDNFFKYTDKNNSKRVYEWIYKH